MANPEHTPELDGFDRMTVALYRSGLCIGAASVAGLAGALAIGAAPHAAYAGVLAGSLLAVLNMHLYDKRIRWVIHGSAQLGALLFVVGGLSGIPLVQLAGLGFSFVCLSGFALKEQFCFKVPGLRLVPLGLALGLVPLVLGLDLVAAGIYALTSVPLGILCVAKWRMPLHFDIGNKAHYQI